MLHYITHTTKTGFTLACISAKNILKFIQPGIKY